MAEGEVAGRKVIEQRVGDLALALTAPDALMAAVRGHLYIESEVQYFLDRQLIRSSELPSKLDYELRLAIALALGLPAPLGGALKKIGWLRNQFAHNLDFELTKQICDSLYQALGTPLQNYAKDFYAGIKRDQPQLPSKFVDLKTRDRVTVIMMSVYSVTAIAVRALVGEIEVHDRQLMRDLGLVV